jgi:type III secretory pathway component EscS
MNIPLLFFICLGVAVLGFIVALINIATGIQRTFKSGSPMSLIVIHIIAGLMYGLGGAGTIGFGIAWIVTYLKH